ncbi:MAG: outer membrane lipoprotein-sorting protein [Clostridia bacterium]|nr:outer membrane lipoprotein-sorting protein [Clostridia bacterium]
MLRIIHGWRVPFAAALVGICLAVGAAAAPAGPTAQQILDSMKGGGSFAGNGRAVIDMTVEKGNQRKSNRVEIYRFDDGHGTSKQMVEFLSPADVKGAKFLSIAEPGAEDQMWLYLPSLGRERRIAGSAVQGKFMGTDFTFEEISTNESTWKAYSAERMPDQVVDGKACYVLKLAPKAKDAAYSGITMWVWQESALPLRIEFQGKSAKAQKVMSFADLSKNADGEWWPKTIILQDTGAGSTTTVKILETDDKRAPDDVFSLRRLRKG